MPHPLSSIAEIIALVGAVASFLQLAALIDFTSQTKNIPQSLHHITIELTVLSVALKKSAQAIVVDSITDEVRKALKAPIKECEAEIGSQDTAQDITKARSLEEDENMEGRLEPAVRCESQKQDSYYPRLCADFILLPCYLIITLGVYDGQVTSIIYICSHVISSS